MEASSAASTKPPDPLQSPENPKPGTAGTSDGERALLLFEDIIRNHMKEALKKTIISPAPENAHLISRDVHSYVITALKEWSPNDWGYTLLVKAAIRAVTAAPDDAKAAGIVDFLEILVNHTISDTSTPPI
jgi:hypothetical protein